MNAVAIETAQTKLTSDDFSRIANLIGEKVGIKLPPQKRLMVEGRLRKRMRQCGRPDLRSYCHYLFEEGGLDRELTQLIDVITTNKTDFFREPHHYELLERSLVPEILAKRNTLRPKLKIWSAASSSGAEAYTAAMVLSDMARQRQDFAFCILGTDISTAMLDNARRAIYPTEMIAPVPKAMQQRYLMRGTGKRHNEVRIVPELRRVVHFRQMNLMDRKYPVDQDVDVIFLRNVLIYFEKRDQEAVVARMLSHLRPEGYLLLGHSESMAAAGAPVRQIGPSVFQKI
ncbi:CheR family methyltransferase [Consotaella salsifontis]|uniref:Chemotaxis protein methyltransferase n=1 Tax=Consotaella salsifontis TaxID=1365950 RepID=A0A1T4QVP0_9HYPH|nr:CheR family methyltransferase [Consotaella salsifontis]SKA07551.1 MCP methyltransferase, CheR-type [Consotaella salsifontis]